jgi:hypothetical protein
MAGTNERIEKVYDSSISVTQFLIRPSLARRSQ